MAQGTISSQIEIRGLSDAEKEIIETALLNLEASGTKVQKWSASVIRTTMLDGLLWIERCAIKGREA